MKKRILILALATLTMSMYSCTMEVNLNGSSYSTSTGKSDSNKNEESSSDKKEKNADKESNNKEKDTDADKKEEATSKSDEKEEEIAPSTEPATEKSTDIGEIESPFEPSDFSPSFSFGTGGVQINSDINQNDDKELISVATDMYKLACETEWNYHIGCPYKLDYESTVEGDFGWQYSLVDEPSITSFADVEKDYYKVFSEKYGNDLDELFIEKDGNVYALAAERGSDIFYQGFKITEVSENTGSEVFFTVENYYDASSGDPHIIPVETSTFSIVKDGNSWRAGEFKLPY